MRFVPLSVTMIAALAGVSAAAAGLSQAKPQAQSTGSSCNKPYKLDYDDKGNYVVGDRWAGRLRVDNESVAEGTISSVTWAPAPRTRRHPATRSCRIVIEKTGMTRWTSTASRGTRVLPLTPFGTDPRTFRLRVYYRTARR